MSKKKESHDLFKQGSNYQHFKLISEGGSYIAGGGPRPGCPSTIEATKNCRTQKAKGNWKAATGRCLGPIDDIHLFDVRTLLSDLDQYIIVVELRQEFEKNGIKLSDNAAVSIEQKGSIWFIIDEKKRYTIRKVKGNFKVYVSNL